MKLKCFLLTVFVLGYLYSNAQYNADRGDNILNLGAGPLQSYCLYLGFSNVIPPLSASYERILKTKTKDMNGSWGVGAYVGFASNKFEYLYAGGTTHTYKYNHIFVGPRAAFHYKFKFAPNLDTYAGIFMGYDIISAQETGKNLSPLDNPKILQSGYA